jgi:hypothetical protein
VVLDTLRTGVRRGRNGTLHCNPRTLEMRWSQGESMGSEEKKKKVRRAILERNVRRA